MRTASIIIPTNRPWAALRPCLSSIAAQNLPADRLEVVLALNGAPTPPEDYSRSAHPFRLRVVELSEPNIAAAKNAALDVATGELVVLVNDDVQLAPDYVATHLAAHAALDSPACVLGLAAWKRYSDQTTFDELVQRTSMIFFYPSMRARAFYNFRHAWNLSLSVPRAWLDAERFDAGLGPFFFEDLELAWRLARRFDARVWYEPAARSLHDHRYTCSGYFDREAALGQASLRLYSCNPECFRDVYGCDLDDDYLGYCERFVRTESRQEAALRDRFEQAAATPAPTSGPNGLTVEQWLDLLYLAHLPLKRLAFRRGVLAGVAARRSQPV